MPAWSILCVTPYSTGQTTSSASRTLPQDGALEEKRGEGGQRLWGGVSTLLIDRHYRVVAAQTSLALANQK